MTTPQPYTRPELDEKELDQAQTDARVLIRKCGFNNAVKIIGLLAVENARLLKECNEHRTARGIEPIPTFKV